MLFFKKILCSFIGLILCFVLLYINKVCASYDSESTIGDTYGNIYENSETYDSNSETYDSNSATYDLKSAIDDTYGSIYENSATNEQFFDFLESLRVDDSGMDIDIKHQILKIQFDNIYDRILSLRNHKNSISYESSDFCHKNILDNWNIIATSSSNKKNKVNISYYNNSKHFIIGLDDYFNNDIILGLSIGFNRFTGNTKTPSGTPRDHKLLQNTYLTSVYVGGYAIKNLFCCTVITSGFCTENFTRLKEKARLQSSYNARKIGATLSAGYEFSTYIFNVEPTINIRLTNIYIEPHNNIPVYSEIPEDSGEIHEQIKYFNTAVGLGVNLNQSWMFSDFFVVPRIRLAFYKRLNKHKQYNINVKFMGVDYNTQIASKNLEVIEYNFGIDFIFKTVNFSIFYNFTKAQWYKDNNISAKLNIIF